MAHLFKLITTALAYPYHQGACRGHRMPSLCASSSATSRASPGVMPLTPRNACAGGQSQPDRHAVWTRFCTAKAMWCAARPLSTHAQRPAARTAARCQPAVGSHPPSPRSAGRDPRRHLARRHRVVLMGMHHAHRGQAFHRHTRRHHARRHPTRRHRRCGRPCPRSLSAVCARGRALAALGRPGHVPASAPPDRSLCREQGTYEAPERCHVSSVMCESGLASDHEPR